MLLGQVVAADGLGDDAVRRDAVELPVGDEVGLVRGQRRVLVRLDLGRRVDQAAVGRDAATLAMAPGRSAIPVGTVAIVVTSIGDYGQVGHAYTQ